MELSGLINKISAANNQVDEISICQLDTQSNLRKRQKGVGDNSDNSPLWISALLSNKKWQFPVVSLMQKKLYSGISTITPMKFDSSKSYISI